MGEELATRKLVVIAIVLLVILLAILAFSPKVRNTLYEWIKGLPEYQYEHDEEIDYTKLSDEERAGLCSGDSFIGKIVFTERAGEKKNFLDFYIKGEKTLRFESLLYWDGEKDNAEIKLLLWASSIFWRRDRVIADVKDYKISVRAEYITPSSEETVELRTKLYNKGGSGLPPPVVLNNLNGAYNLNGYICKKK